MLISAILSAPWHEHIAISLRSALAGSVGFVYSLMILRGTLRVTYYKMVLEDWAWHVVLPLLAYGAILGTAMLFARYTVVGLFLVGGSATLLVFIGIHNAWDTVTHLTLQRLKREQEKPDR